jgi:hypothetical protein
MQPFNTLRNYLAERISRIRREWKLFNSNEQDPVSQQTLIQDSDTTRHYATTDFFSRDPDSTKTLNAELSVLTESFRLDYQTRHQPFELNAPLHPDTSLPDNRIPADGIAPVPLFFHTGRILHPDPAHERQLKPDEIADAAESYLPGDTDLGQPADPYFFDLCTRKYPEYLPHLHQYCRPAGTTDATFRDFNKPQIQTQPASDSRHERIMQHVIHFLDATPFLPIHFVDTQYAKLPLHTGTGYYNRFSFRQRAHAKYSRPEEYKHKPTSKGYYINATLDHARRLIHNIKDKGLPFSFTLPDDPNDITDEILLTLIRLTNEFINSHPTLLFTRNHISQRDGTLKVRPVYAVDDLFLLIELMLTFPLVVQARKPSCAIMYGLETLRGSNHFIDSLAQDYQSFFTIDWSGYDQRLPRPITDSFFNDFLRRLIIISDGYAPTYEYPLYPDLSEDKMYTKMDNLLHFQHLWYNNMTYLSADGYAYRRLYAGVPSGLYLTQYLDSYGNLYLLIDGMCEFGFTDDEIRSFVLLVLGDDNSAMTHFPLSTLIRFVSFLESYCLERWNMVLSKTKSVITSLRSKIETLSYQCNFGSPRRPIPKMVAQLCYPEHGLKYSTMAFRAIGLAFASCGQDRTFHSFCFDIYKHFLPYSILTPDISLTMQKWLPAPFFSSSDPEDLEILLSRFPTLDEVRSFISSYRGPLQYAPKWNYAHFKYAPDYCPPFFLTMRDYEILHDIKPRPIPTLPTLIPSDQDMASFANFV